MRTFLFTRPRGNSLYFLHGELLCQGVSRAVLLASSKTHKKLRPRKQRTYRRSSLRGDFAFPSGCPRRLCPAAFPFSSPISSPACSGVRRLVGNDQPVPGGESDQSFMAARVLWTTELSFPPLPFR